MNIETVNELIKSLESAGELSIREQKFLKLAKEFRICSASLDAAIKTGNMLADQNAQLAAENVEAKKIISECREYFIAGVMNRIRPTNEGYLHMICDTFADETPATDRIVAGIKADGVEMFALMFAEEAIKDNNITTGWKARASRAASEYAELLREGADK
ncbi:hypothetical protein [Klebsiella pneumoniae]|uniref:Ead/Ea22-like family protein n=1 Tax=Klebsiella pneumoniae TaxID=573 RepID=A0A6G4TPP3_KLEPN|nr:hypothetical protein [Klebsiella pneumoniae]MBM6457204.1 hypothetical protein [Klebsiella pneumoniae]MBM9449711.1 hypothetical protein [Klebsiella pneumoniae]MCS7336237.1 hypothetical protein [Klebsiella pneumoniae]MCS7357302.1 hypothetical protein [Klebsiella pneumoniae]MCS7362890.1 hypothetical protein [Klebsiella pneumoniae]